MMEAVSYILTMALAVLIPSYMLFSYLKKYRLYKEVAKLPGPSTLPIIGNAHHYLGSTRDIFETFMHHMDQYSSPYRIWLGSKLIYVIYKPEQIQTVLLSSKAINRVELYDFIVPWLGNGLITASAAEWKVHRKAIAPSFNQQILKSYVGVFSMKSGIMVKEMEIEANGKEFEILQYISLCTLDMISETTTGVPSNEQTQKRSDYVEAATKVLEIVFFRMFNIWMHPDIIFYNTNMGKKMQESIRYLHKHTDDVIRQKKETLNRNETCRRENKFLLPSDKGMKTFLELLIESSSEENKLTEKDLREEVDTMVATGQESVATESCFAFLMLASYPKIQDKVYEELYEVYGNKDPCAAPVKSEDLHRMEYLERVIKETLRLFPTSGLVFRRLSDDLDIGGHILAKGSSVGVGLIKLHRSEEYWPEPMTFNPDRFLPEECEKRHPHVYLPFGAGPRNCIGAKYAMIVMKTLIATVLRKYVIKKNNILPIQDIKLKVDLGLKPEEPITIFIENRIHGKDGPD